MGNRSNLVVMSDSHAASTLAASAKLARGRPVGTGIDDTERLIVLRARLAADPQLKPTTAIKALGLTDPSVIRRLRDKLKQTPTGQAAPETVNASARVEPAVERHVTATAASARPFRLKEDPAETPPRQPPEQPFSARSQRPPADPLLVSSLDFAIRAWTTAVTAQLGMMTLMLQNPLVRQSMQQQIAFNEVIMGLMRPPKAPNR